MRGFLLIYIIREKGNMVWDYIIAMLVVNMNKYNEQVLS